jgi:hypothetical protein
MTIDDVIKLSKARLSDDLIIQQIRKKGQRFDLSTDQLLQLKNAQVSERIIQVMIDPKRDSPAVPAQKLTTVPDAPVQTAPPPLQRSGDVDPNTATNPAFKRPSTHVSGHRIGETFQEWMTINQLDLADICQNHPRSDKRTDYKAICKRLSLIRDTGRGEFYLGDATIRQAFRWVFVGSKLALASTEYALPDIEQQLKFLTLTYGQPTKTETVKYQNGYGAAWDCLEATWFMPDGVVIRAAESIKNVYGPIRWLTVTFMSKEMVDAYAQIENSKPNPYAW